MSRNRAPAKAAGTRFESLIAGALAEHVAEWIERRTKSGARDRGDISGLRVHGQRVVVECKDVTRMALADWITQTEVERANDDALVGVVAHKRRGHGDPLDQYVSMTLRDFIALTTGVRPDA